MRKITSLLMLFCMCVATAWAGPTDLPEITTDLENPIYYTIYNTRSTQPGGLMYWAGDNVGIKDGLISTSLSDEYKFYFTGSHDALYVHNAATGKKLASIGNGNKAKGSWTDEGAVWAVGVSPMGGGLAFGPQGGLNGQNCWNDCNYNTGDGNPDFTGWYANDAGSVFVCEKADTYVFPQSEKLYVIECPLFEGVQGVKKALYINMEGLLAWGTLDLTDKAFYWTPVIHEGKTILKNAKVLPNTAGWTEPRYLDGINATNKINSATEFALRPLGANQFNIISGDKTIHAEGHGGGVNGSGNIVHYGGVLGSASAWTFTEKQDPDAIQELTVRYKFTHNSIVLKTQETKVLVGEDYPAFMTMPFGVTTLTGKPAEKVAEADAIDGVIEKEIEISTANLPFTYAADYASIENWYYFKFHANNNYYLYHKADQDHIKLDRNEVVSDEKDAHSWAFIGNPFDGYQIVNKKTGEGWVLSSSTTIDGDGANTWPVMTQTTNLSGNEFWIPTPSTHAENGFFLAQKDHPTHRMNGRDGKLAYWTGGADAGSTFVAELSRSNEEEILALVADYNAWKSARTIGTALGQYSCNDDVLSTAEVELDAATTPEEARTAIAKCKATFVINQPSVGKFYRIKSMNANDDAKKGKYWQVNATGAGMELQKDANYSKLRSVIYYTADNTFISFSNGQYINKYQNPAAQGAEPLTWHIEENNAVVGTYALYRTKEDGNRDGYCLSDWYGVTYGQEDANAAWMIEEVTWLPIPVNVEAGWTSIYSPVELELSSNRFKAYTVSAVSETSATLVEQTVVPAGVGVVLEYQDGAEVENGCVFLKIKATKQKLHLYSKEHMQIHSSKIMLMY
ncbi:MAG: hypothetical protein IIV54_06245 [Bacteroidaceae bacterium]|nr:hypothetical protein [Bacteroidaceae bacterium]